MSWFFLAVCCLLLVRNVFTMTYYTQKNGQAERFNRTITSALPHSLADNQKNWDLFTDALTFGYNCTVNPMTGLKPLEFALTRPPTSFSLQNRPTLDIHIGPLAKYKAQYLRWRKGLMSTTLDALREGQNRYKRYYDARVRKPCPEFKVGDQVLVEREIALRNREKTPKDRVNNKLAPLCEGPFHVIGVRSHTVTIIRADGTRERLSKDRTTKFPHGQLQPAEAEITPAFGQQSPEEVDGGEPEARTVKPAIQLGTQVASTGLRDLLDEGIDTPTGRTIQIRSHVCTAMSLEPPQQRVRPSEETSATQETTTESFPSADNERS